MPQSYKFENALDREYNDERHIDVVQDGRKHLGLLVVFKRHGQHVQHDYYHDPDVKFLVGHSIKNPSHDYILYKKKQTIT